MKKAAGILAALISLMIFAASPSQAAVDLGSAVTSWSLRSGWYGNGSSRFYYGKDGRFVTGKQRIDGKLYYFRKDGKLIAKKGVKTIKERGKNVYYFCKADGSLAENTWVQDDVYWCYAGDGGALYTGKQYINGKEYHFSKDGRSTGYWKQSGNTWCYYSDRGKAEAFPVRNTSDHKALRHLDKKSLDSMHLSDTPNLMITAHADDELLWGGESLLKEKYLVVVITGADAVPRGGPRRLELQRVTELTGDKSIIMYYPDSYKDPYMIDDWLDCGNAIYKDLQTLIKYKKWNKIVTHNPQGEYGHIHHKLTNEKVTKVCKSQKSFDNLYYFGRWYPRKSVEAHKSSLHQASAKTFQKLKTISKSYIGQFKTVKKYSYMMEYQTITKASQWR